MKQSKMEALFDEFKTNMIEWKGKCHACKEQVSVIADWGRDGITVSGGAVYEPEDDEDTYLKCQKCFDRDHTLRNYQKTEVYSRVVGYLRPVQQWNGAKRCEHTMRKNFKTPEVTA